MCEDSGLVFRFDNLIPMSSPVSRSRSSYFSTNATNADGSGVSIYDGTSKFAVPASIAGKPSASARFVLITESASPISLCKLEHARSVVGKLTTSKLLRRWESHSLIIARDRLRSTTVGHFLTI